MEISVPMSDFAPFTKELIRLQVNSKPSGLLSMSPRPSRLQWIRFTSVFSG